MTSLIMERGAMVLLVVLLALVLRFILVFTIKRVTKGLIEQRVPEPDEDLGSKAKWFLARASGLAHERHRQRVSTLGSLLRNIVDIVIGTIAILTILAILGVPMTPLLASAGVGGVAIGFGAQSLVKDYISGVFMLAEDQFGIGDFIQVGDLKGRVLQVTLRVTKIRDEAGAVWYIRNGEILRLGNVSQGYAATGVDVEVMLDEDPARVGEVLGVAVAGMESEPEWEHALLAPPKVLGVQGMGDETMTFRVALKAENGREGALLREVRMRCLAACRDQGVRVPA